MRKRLLSSFPPQLQISPPPRESGPPLPAVLLPAAVSVTPLIDPLVQITDIQAELKAESEVLSEPSDEFVDLTNNITSSPDDPAPAANSAAKNASEISLEESSDEFVDLTGSESEASSGGAAAASVTVEAASDKSEGEASDQQMSNEQGRKEAAAAPVSDLLGDRSASNAQQRGGQLIHPLVNLLSEAPASLDANSRSQAAVDLFEDEGSDLFAEPQQFLSAKQPQKSLFDEPERDLFGEPLGAASKQPASKQQKSKPVAAEACREQGDLGGPLQSAKPAEPADIFAEEGVSAPSTRASRAVGSKTNGVHAQQDADLFTGTSPV